MIGYVQDSRLGWNVYVGLFLLGYCILDVSLILAYGSPHSLGWLSNSAGFVLAFALLFGLKNLAVMMSALSFTGEGVWTIDYFSGLLFGWFPFNATNYAFVPGYPMELIIAAMIHVVLWFAAGVTLLMWANQWPTPSRKESMAFASFCVYLGAAGFLLPREKNVNCLWESCIRFIPTFPGYLLGYVLLYVALTLTVLWCAVRISALRNRN